MTLDQILIANPLPDDLIGSVRYFDHLCDQLTDVTDQENDTFFVSDVLVSVGASTRKTALLDTFEEQAEKIFAEIKSAAPLNTSLHRYFIDRLDVLQDKLRINTSLQLHAMSRVHEQLSGNFGGQEVFEQCH